MGYQYETVERDESNQVCQVVQLPYTSTLIVQTFIAGVSSAKAEIGNGCCLARSYLPIHIQSQKGIILNTQHIVDFRKHFQTTFWEIL